MSGEFPAADAWGAIFLWISKPSAYKKSVATSELIYLPANQTLNPIEVLNDFFRSSAHLEDTCAGVKTKLVELFEEKPLVFECDWNSEGDLTGCWVAVRLSVPKNGGFGPHSIDVVICGEYIGI